MNVLDIYRDSTKLFRSDDIRDIMSAIPSDKKGTVRSWFQNDKAGKSVLTFSITVDKDGDVSGQWSPGIREVEQVKGTYAILDGSRADFGGKVIAANDNYIIFSHTWGDRTKIFGHRVF